MLISHARMHTCKHTHMYECTDERTHAYTHTHAHMHKIMALLFNVNVFHDVENACSSTNACKWVHVVLFYTSEVWKCYLLLRQYSAVVHILCFVSMLLNNN